jgi:dGTPase
MAIAVGHDLGHAPFGHRGEECLDKLATRHGLGFSHELHSLRVVDVLESPYREHPGLNLTFAVRDGIACHYGEGFEQELKPDCGKRVERLDSMQRGEDRPVTLEGCVVRWADKIAYLGRDLEDAITLGILRREELPEGVKTVLGSKNAEIIGSLVQEILWCSREDGAVCVGDQVHQALNEFYMFSKEKIYHSEKARQSWSQVEQAMAILFEFLLKELERASDNPNDLFGERRVRCLQVFRQFLEEDVKDWREVPPARTVIDFIAGMTDSFFISSVRDLFLPTETV